MKTFRRSVLLMAATLLVAQGAFAYCANKDLKNLGPTAHDLAVILSGTQNVTSTFNGYSAGSKAGRFGSVAVGPSGGNTQIHWQNFNDGTDKAINTGQVIHVGWCTSAQSNVVNMYWTDKQGNPISGSVVYNITSGWRYTTNFLVAVFQNHFPVPVRISDVRWAAFPTPFGLDQINTENQELNDALQPAPGGESFMVAPGEVVELRLPDIPPGWALNLRYQVSGSGSDAEALDFIEDVITPPGSDTDEDRDPRN
jgi:hypothetical protein